MPRGLYVLHALISFSFLKYTFQEKISESIALIFTKFSPCGRYLTVDYRSDTLFLMAQETLPWLPSLGSTLAKSDYLPLFVALAFLNGLQYSHSDF